MKMKLLDNLLTSILITMSIASIIGGTYLFFNGNITSVEYCIVFIGLGGMGPWITFYITHGADLDDL